MKSIIESRLSKHVLDVTKKENLSADDVNFLVFYLNRIELLENVEKDKIALAESKEKNKQWLETMLKGVIS